MMEAFVKFIRYLPKIRGVTVVEDSWATLKLSGKVKDLDLTELGGSAADLKELQAAKLFLFEIEGGEKRLSVEDLQPYTRGNFTDNNWTATFLKDTFFSHQSGEAVKMNFFLSVSACQTWLQGVDIFDDRSPIYSGPLIIFVDGLKVQLGNSLFGFCPCDVQSVVKLAPADNSLPHFDTLKEVIHFITAAHFYVDPGKFLLEQTTEALLLPTLVRHAIRAMACGLADEVYSQDKLIFAGGRRVIFDKMISDNDVFTLDDYVHLKAVVSWIYEDKAAVRKKLFNERFTLDADETLSLAFNLKIYAGVALEQAQERYIFVITERKDAYVKELKDLLKDLRGQSDLYSGKIRTLLGNFLRDALASLVLVGFTIFTKFSEDLTLNKHQLLTYVFWALGAYFLFSIIMQAVHDWTDIIITSKELKYWKSVSKELIADATFEKHFKASLKNRRNSLYTLYPIIAALYLLIAFCCFKYPSFFEKLINKEQAKEKKVSVQVKTKSEPR
ncbi:hypothetical protein [Mucilaginibacter dorajii]|uniref:Uncharacterized protein n=1 Tax=Mucilaginibacter dorajii TaxID=692994 RepID=A0ABP7R656_9SPHI|nr:hypothetical protein [Mucilaginibacter dorajii]MCS3737698.1 hypothetical protein [Mucilaginibacter dorajii]